MNWPFVMRQRRNPKRSPVGSLRVDILPPDTDPPLSRNEWLGLAGVTLAAFVLRAIMLGRAALWIDEMCFIIYLVSPDTNPLEAFLRHWQSITFIGHMPLPGTLQNAYYGLLGLIGVTDVPHSPLLNRLPMLVAGTLAVPGIFFAARTLFRRGVASWSVALLMACFFYPVYYSREAYCYAYVLLFGAWGLAAWVRLFSRGGRGDFLAAFLAFAGMALSHLGAVVAVAVAAAVAGVLWLVALVRQAPRDVVFSRLLGWLAPLLAFMVAAPFFAKFMLCNTAHIGTGHAPSIWIVWSDGVSKMFLGERPFAAVLAWVVLGAGIACLAFIGRRERTSAASLVAATLVMGVCVLGVATTRTQYISARYFTPLAPLMYVAFGAGLSAIAHVVVLVVPQKSRLRSSDGATIGLTTCCILPQIFYFLPMYWVLHDRQEPFQRAAAWMNANLRRGTPYVLEYAYQYRWLGQFYPTPDLVPLAPFIQEGQKERDTLLKKQSELCDQIPEAAYVQLCGTNGTEADPPWNWPATKFRNRMCIGNPELRRLIRSGIFPGVPFEYVEDWDYDINIFFNRRSDLIQLARQDSGGVLVDFSEWLIQGQQVSPQEIQYFRLPQNARRTFTIESVNDGDVSGTLDIEFVIVGPLDETSDVTLTYEDLESRIAGAQHGKLLALKLEVGKLRPGGSEASFMLPSAVGAPRTVAVRGAHWTPRDGTPHRAADASSNRTAP